MKTLQVVPRPLRVRSFPATTRRSILGLFLLLLAGCGVRAGGGDDPFRSAAAAEQITLEIRNDNFLDARIYSLWNGERRRIGTVSGVSERTFDIEFRVGDLRIHADFLSAGEFTSNRIVAQPGDTLRLVLPAR